MPFELTLSGMLSVPANAATTVLVVFSVLPLRSLVRATEGAGLYTPTTLLYRESPVGNSSDIAYLFLNSVKDGSSSASVSLYGLNVATKIDGTSAQSGLALLSKALPFLKHQNSSTAFAPSVADDGSLYVFAGSCSSVGSELWQYRVNRDTDNNSRLSGDWRRLGVFDIAGPSFLGSATAFSTTLAPTISSPIIYSWGGVCPAPVTDPTSSKSWISDAKYSNNVTKVQTFRSTDAMASRLTNKGPVPEAGFSFTELLPGLRNTTKNMITQQRNVVVLGGHTAGAFVNMSTAAIWSLPEESWGFVYIGDSGKESDREMALRKGIQSSVVEPRSGHTAVLSEDGTTIAIYGGWVGDRTQAAKPQLALLSVGEGFGGTGAWTWSIPDEQPSGPGIYGHGATLLPGNVMMVYGGFDIEPSPPTIVSRDTTSSPNIDLPSVANAHARFLNLTSLSWIPTYSNPYLVRPKPPPVVSGKPTSHGVTSQLKKLGLGLGIGFGVLAILIAILFFLWYRRRVQRRVKIRQEMAQALAQDKYLNPESYNPGRQSMVDTTTMPDSRTTKSFPWKKHLAIGSSGSHGGSWNGRESYKQVSDGNNPLGYEAELGKAGGVGFKSGHPAPPPVIRQPSYRVTRSLYTPGTATGDFSPRNALVVASPVAANKASHIHPIYEADEDGDERDNSRAGPLLASGRGFDERGSPSEPGTPTTPVFASNDPFVTPVKLTNTSLAVTPPGTTHPANMTAVACLPSAAPGVKLMSRTPCDPDVEGWAVEVNEAEKLLNRMNSKKAGAMALATPSRSVHYSESAEQNQQSSAFTESNTSERSAATSNISVASRFRMFGLGRTGSNAQRHHYDGPCNHTQLLASQLQSQRSGNPRSMALRLDEPRSSLSDTKSCGGVSSSGPRINSTTAIATPALSAVAALHGSTATIANAASRVGSFQHASHAAANVQPNKAILTTAGSSSDSNGHGEGGSEVSFNGDDEPEIEGQPSSTGPSAASIGCGTAAVVAPVAGASGYESDDGEIIGGGRIRRNGTNRDWFGNLKRVFSARASSRQSPTHGSESAERNRSSLLGGRSSKTMPAANADHSGGGDYFTTTTTTVPSPALTPTRCMFDPALLRRKKGKMAWRDNDDEAALRYTYPHDGVAGTAISPTAAGRARAASGSSLITSGYRGALSNDKPELDGEYLARLNTARSIGEESDWDIERAVEQRLVQVMFTVPKERLRVVNAEIEREEESILYVDEETAKSIAAASRLGSRAPSGSDQQRQLSRDSLRAAGSRRQSGASRNFSGGGGEVNVQQEARKCSSNRRTSGGSRRVTPVALADPQGNDPFVDDDPQQREISEMMKRLSRTDEVDELLRQPFSPSLVSAARSAVTSAEESIASPSSQVYRSQRESTFTVPGSATTATSSGLFRFSSPQSGGDESDIRASMASTCTRTPVKPTSRHPLTGSSVLECPRSRSRHHEDARSERTELSFATANEASSDGGYHDVDDDDDDDDDDDLFGDDKECEMGLAMTTPKWSKATRVRVVTPRMMNSTNSSSNTNISPPLATAVSKFSQASPTSHSHRDRNPSIATFVTASNVPPPSPPSAKVDAFVASPAAPTASKPRVFYLSNNHKKKHEGEQIDTAVTATAIETQAKATEHAKHYSLTPPRALPHGATVTTSPTRPRSRVLQMVESYESLLKDATAVANAPDGGSTGPS